MIVSLEFGQMGPIILFIVCGARGSSSIGDGAQSPEGEGVGKIIDQRFPGLKLEDIQRFIRIINV